MRLPVCNFDLESDMLCTNCQARLDRGEITPFDITFITGQYRRTILIAGGNKLKK